MSMLAEPRRKQRVINLRAKNNDWSNDNNKFGQRMLEKMGWSSGKGLGANEDGMVEHVVARFKNDDKGLGYKDNNDHSTKTNEAFDALLTSLSQPGSSSKEKLHSGISLEVKSKKSKSRIHYSKYTRGKDLSRYSEKDLANIFGKKNFEIKEKNKMKESVGEVEEVCDKVFTEKGSMDDYFKMKLTTMKSKIKSSRNCENSGGEDGEGSAGHAPVDNEVFLFRGFSQSDDATISNKKRKMKIDLIDTKIENNEEVPAKKVKKTKKIKSRHQETEYKGAEDKLDIV